MKALQWETKCSTVSTLSPCLFQSVPAWRLYLQRTEARWHSRLPLRMKWTTAHEYSVCLNIPMVVSMQGWLKLLRGPRCKPIVFVQKNTPNCTQSKLKTPPTHSAYSWHHHAICSYKRGYSSMQGSTELSSPAGSEKRRPSAWLF